MQSQSTSPLPAIAPPAPGQAITIVPPPSVPTNNLVKLAGVTMPFLMVILLGFPLVKAFARWMDRRLGNAPGPAPIGGITQEQFLQLQASVDAIAVEVERISEAQRFTVKLMSERPASAIEAGRQETH